MLNGDDGRLIVTATELAEWLKMSTRSVSNHAADGRLVKAGKGFYLKESVQAFVEHQRGIAAGRGGEEAVLDLTKERARLAKEQADAQELKNRVQRGEYGLIADMKRAMEDSYRKTGARVLAVPNRVRQLLGHIGQMEASVIDRELRDALAELGHADD